MALERGQEEAWIYVNRGQCLYANEDFSKSIADYTKALTLEPANPDARRGAVRPTGSSASQTRPLRTTPPQFASSRRSLNSTRRAATLLDAVAHEGTRSDRL